MKSPLTRREVLAGLTALGVVRLPGPAHAADGPLQLEDPRPFSFDALADRARRLAAEPYVPPQVRGGGILDRIDFDAHWKIKYRADALLDVADGKAPVSLFHLGRYFQIPVNIHLVDGDQARQLVYDEALFDMPADSPARDLPHDVGFAGFRVMGQNATADWLAFLGGCYFRSAGELNQYGLSARAVAVDVAMPTPEEFPRFTDFYLGPPSSPEHDLSITCPLDSQRMTGVVRIDVGKRGRVIMDIQARFFARADIDRVGLAPLTSMFWYSETDRDRRIDWRPEVHDSDGLAIWTGAGERIWRPLNNPARVITSSFADRDPKGFGLMQRDRSFQSYEDDGVYYDRRPSLWVEPKGGWGPGSVQLVEIPTDDEIHDNIVASWVPEKPFRRGDAIALDYRLIWSKDDPYPPAVATVSATRMGRGGIPGQPRPADASKFAVDFDGGKVAALARDATGVEAVVTASRGTLSRIDAYSVKVGTAWRSTFDLTVDGTEPVDLRLYLVRNGEVLTETWLCQYLPLQSARGGA
ncbi:glucan biosynthesis protein [Aurantimonas sp. HBX-1]|uniref:glucan biosynthesis protein n=1 Tax=Aurantimonas sp. HBX-1 TaxID=2906072 RepID=UPI001F429008|nr:glucan biosynthesis protein D [Aurantimonas sp. HBX-1]UIJ72943.1 glucan biosynthesis protein D [Aurantimonas sp. HBX-1]